MNQMFLFDEKDKLIRPIRGNESTVAFITWMLNTGHLKEIPEECKEYIEKEKNQ